jgi:hypothetical protein
MAFSALTSFSINYQLMKIHYLPLFRSLETLIRFPFSRVEQKAPREGAALEVPKNSELLNLTAAAQSGHRAAAARAAAARAATTAAAGAAGATPKPTACHTRSCAIGTDQ